MAKGYIYLISTPVPPSPDSLYIPYILHIIPPRQAVKIACRMLPGPGTRRDRRGSMHLYTIHCIHGCEFRNGAEWNLARPLYSKQILSARFRRISEKSRPHWPTSAAPMLSLPDFHIPFHTRSRMYNPIPPCLKNNDFQYL